MFFVLLIVTFLVALAVSFLVVRPFAGPIVGILQRIIATTSVLLSGEVKRGPGLFSGRLSSLSVALVLETDRKSFLAVEKVVERLQLH